MFPIPDGTRVAAVTGLAWYWQTYAMDADVTVWQAPLPGEQAAKPPGAQNPMASRSSRTVPRPGRYSALRMSRRLTALGYP